MCLFADMAHAACVTGRTVACVTANGSAGTRECVGGRFTTCAADFDTGDKPCRTACGTSGFEVLGHCRAAEVCNAVPCDDDGDGEIDEGLKCVNWPLEPRCPANDVTVGAVKLTTDELVGVRSSDNVLDFSGNEVANLDGNHVYGDTIISPATVVWAFAPPDCAKSTTVTFTGLRLGPQSEIRVQDATSGSTTGRIAGSRASLPLTQSLQLPRSEQVFVASLAGATRQNDGLELRSFTMKSIGAPVTALTHQLKVERWTYGVLLQAGDTQFFELPSDDSKRDVIVWVEAGTKQGSNADVDLFISVDRAPTIQSSDFSARGTSFGEAIRIPGGSSHKVVAAVQAFSGAMWFRIHAARISTDNQYNKLTAGFTYSNFGPTDIADAASALRSGRRGFFGATLGRRFIRDISIVVPTEKDKCQNLDLCFRNVAGTSHSTFHTVGFYPRISIYRPASGTPWSEYTLSHEFGHFWLNVFDEYVEHPRTPVRRTDAQCAVSKMGNGASNRLCVAANHGKSGHMATHLCGNMSGDDSICVAPLAGGFPMWPTVVSQFPGVDPQYSLPENTDYYDFVWLDSVLGGVTCSNGQSC